MMKPAAAARTASVTTRSTRTHRDRRMRSGGKLGPTRRREIKFNRVLETGWRLLGVILTSTSASRPRTGCQDSCQTSAEFEFLENVHTRAHMANRNDRVRLDLALPKVFLTRERGARNNTAVIISDRWRGGWLAGCARPSSSNRRRRPSAPKRL